MEKAEKYGHKIAFASARAYRDCIPVITEKYRNNLIFSLNGAAVFENGKILKHNIISPKAYKKIVKICVDYDLPYFIDNEIDYSYNKAEKINFFKFVDTNKIAKALDINILQRPTKIVIFLKDNQEIKDEILFELSRNSDVELMYHEKEEAIYINPKNINKANSIKEIITSSFITFGNDKNDIEMFKLAHYSVRIGDYLELGEFSDETIEIDENVDLKISDKIIKLFEKFS